MIHTNALFWFGNDLRLHDNPALLRAAESSLSLACVYCVEPRWFKTDQFGTRPMGSHRWRFLKQSLDALAGELKKCNHSLTILYGEPAKELSRVIVQYDIEALFRSEIAGFYEQRTLNYIRELIPNLYVDEHASHTLFHRSQLPFADQLPTSFSKFRRIVERLDVDTPEAPPKRLPPEIRIDVQSSDLPPVEEEINSPFVGGEARALAHTEAYFADKHALRYKETRNELDGWRSSTKFSPWLANGSLSPKRLLQQLKTYEAEKGANDSTYWIFFELLWREYFQWYAHRYGTRLFRFRGIQQRKPLTSFYPQRFHRWKAGTTRWPIVNACMRELNTTGYMSNRGRQLVASALVNELALDWRCGAAYFEQQLLDYDVASNWGNWQYIAGVGADPRGGRHFHLDKQTQLYDPDGRFVDRWKGQDEVSENSAPIDYYDAADWPIDQE